MTRYKHSQVNHVLVHTDTALGTATAELVRGVIVNNVSLVSAGGLRTDDLASFREALADLTRQLDTIIQSYRQQGWFVVFNLTGGFKSLNGYLQTLAMITADRCVFLYERATELMEIPRLPMRLAELDEIREHVELFRRIAVGYQVPATAADGAPGRPSGQLLRVDVEAIDIARGEDRIFQKAPVARQQTLRIAPPARREGSDVSTFFGTWPGDETDDELLDALQALG